MYNDYKFNLEEKDVLEWTGWYDHDGNEIMAPPTKSLIRNIDKEIKIAINRVMKGRQDGCRKKQKKTL